MCSTCGCSDESQIVMTIPGKEPVFYHSHAPGELHTHAHEAHHHHHNGNAHVHEHTHGDSRVIELEQDILHKNSLIAERNRGYFDALSISAFNLVSSPGSGKTSLLERTLSDMAHEIDICVIEGDQQTSNDADRIAKFEVPVLQINTGKACHLDAAMVSQALKSLKPASGSYLFIENVGNLVCPAMFDLGEAKRVVIMSVTEGEDKAIKYPDMFSTSDLCIINKIDILPYVNFDVEKAKEYARRVNHHLEFIELSATTGQGVEEWYNWLRNIKQT